MTQRSVDNTRLDFEETLLSELSEETLLFDEAAASDSTELAHGTGCACASCCAERNEHSGHNHNHKDHEHPDILPVEFSTPEVTPSFFFNGDERGGTADNGKPSLTNDEAALQITRSGAAWSNPGSVTYAYRSSVTQAVLDDIEIGDFSRFSELQIQQTELTLQSWADIANITFTRVGTGTTGEDAFSDNASMLFANYSTGADGAAAFAYFPGSTGNSSYSGDSWYNVSLSYNATPALLGYGRQVIAHEIGHAIGLSHPGVYNAGDGQPITYANDAEYYEDSRQYTVMSYFGGSNTGADLQGFSGAPLMDDIAAVQSIYGANLNTRTGDTIYGFNSNTGRDFYEATNANSLLIFSVWDAGGYDTFDFSGYSQDQLIDLTELNFSNTGGQTGNVSIAAGVTIEKAIGGSGNDTLIGGAGENVRTIAPSYDGVPTSGTPFTKTASDINNTFATAISIDGGYHLGSNANIENSTTIPHTTINGQGSGDLDYYSFTITRPGQTITFDIDSTVNLDAYLYLYDANQALIAENDDSTLDIGSSIIQDSFLEYTFEAAGLYYILVNRWESGGFGTGPAVGTSYSLHVSLADPDNEVLESYLGYELDGDAGNDRLEGSAGQDIFTGGAGIDTIVLADNTGADRVTDFETGTDKIDLSAFNGQMYVINGRGATLVDLQTSLVFVQDGADTLLMVRAPGKQPVSYDAADALLIFEDTNAQDFSLDDIIF
jgi:serralysin